MRRPATYFANVLNRLTSTNFPKNIQLCIKQGIFCHPGAILRNESDRRVLKKFQGRPYKTSCNIFWNNFKHIDI